MQIQTSDMYSLSVSSNQTQNKNVKGVREKK